MKLTEKELELIQEVADSNGIRLYIQEEYSGRGMFGDTTVGLVLDSDSDFRELALEVAIEDLGIGRKIAGAKSDSLGKGFIYY